MPRIIKEPIFIYVAVLFGIAFSVAALEHYWHKEDMAASAETYRSRVCAGTIDNYLEKELDC